MITVYIHTVIKFVITSRYPATPSESSSIFKQVYFVRLMKSAGNGLFSHTYILFSESSQSLAFPEFVYADDAVRWQGVIWPFINLAVFSSELVSDQVHA